MIVLFHKKDGGLRFCVDYRQLSSVTIFPLPRIVDLFDQLGNAKYFTTLDLAAGYWQIRVADDSIENRAFITPNGLFEFQVMPFGLTNAPVVFQRLMQNVLKGLNPVECLNFISSLSRCLSHQPHIGPITSSRPKVETQQKSICLPESGVSWPPHHPSWTSTKPKKVSTVTDFQLRH